MHRLHKRNQILPFLTSCPGILTGCRSLLILKGVLMVWRDIGCDLCVCVCVCVRVCVCVCVCVTVLTAHHHQSALSCGITISWHSMLATRAVCCTLDGRFLFLHREVRACSQTASAFGETYRRLITWSFGSGATFCRPALAFSTAHRALGRVLAAVDIAHCSAAPSAPAADVDCNVLWFISV